MVCVEETAHADICGCCFALVVGVRCWWLGWAGGGRLRRLPDLRKYTKESIMLILRQRT